MRCRVRINKHGSGRFFRRPRPAGLKDGIQGIIRGILPLYTNNESRCCGWFTEMQFRKIKYFQLTPDLFSFRDFYCRQVVFWEIFITTLKQKTCFVCIFFSNNRNDTKLLIHIFLFMGPLSKDLMNCPLPFLVFNFYLLSFSGYNIFQVSTVPRIIIILYRFLLHLLISVFLSLYFLTFHYCYCFWIYILFVEFHVLFLSKKKQVTPSNLLNICFGSHHLKFSMKIYSTNTKKN